MLRGDAHAAPAQSVRDAVAAALVSRRAILAIFVLSGAAGLVYEVVWARQLVLVFGNTTQAVSTILTGFFGGMAIGSWLGGRLADRVRRPLRMYATLELVLVVVVLATPLTFRLIHGAYAWAFGALEIMPTILALVRFGLALLALAPATILMGATLPTLTRYLSRDAGHLSSAFGRLYAANTIGAIIGAATAGLVLIELLGLTGTLAMGACCSLLAGLAALLIDRRRRPATEEAADAGLATDTAEAAGASSATADVPTSAVAGRTEAAAPVRTAEVADQSPLPRVALTVAFVSGLTSLAYQTLWTRLLAAGTGNSTYVFTLILVIFLCGLAIGAVLFMILRPRLRNTVRVLAFAQVTTAFLAIAGIALVISRPGSAAAVNAGSIGLVVLPATIIMGLSFPAASGLVSEGEGRIATSAGLLLAVNTLGAIVGTFVVPFFVVPAVGSAQAVGLVVLVNAVLAIWLALRGRIRERMPRVTVVGLGCTAIVVVGVGLVVGTVFVDPTVARLRARGAEIFASREDEIASVQAGDLGGRQLWVTGTSMTALTVDAKLMPILPLILRPAARDALVVALGMGTAFRGAVIAGLDTDAVELVPSVPTMFGYYYPDAAAILERPNGRVIVTDGRNYMELTDRRYDIIVTDPPPPSWSSGVSVISSLEYYEAGRAHLKPGGIMMQWVPGGMTIDEFRAHVRTFARVFPHVTIMLGQGGPGHGGYGFYMLGSEDPMTFTPDAIRAAIARLGVLEDISSADDSPEHTVDGWVARIMGMTWLADDRVAAFAGQGPLVTDDRPLPEYFLLHRLLGAPSPLVVPYSLPATGSPLP
jgi:spermidine synthase